VVVARPDDCESLEVKRVFLWLACEVRQALASVGVTELLVSRASSLQSLGEILEQEGLLSKKTFGSAHDAFHKGRRCAENQLEGQLEPLF
jgi:hypothetical protein